MWLMIMVGYLAAWFGLVVADHGNSVRQRVLAYVVLCSFAFVGYMAGQS